MRSWASAIADAEGFDWVVNFAEVFVNKGFDVVHMRIHHMFGKKDQTLEARSSRKDSRRSIPERLISTVTFIFGDLKC